MNSVKSAERTMSVLTFLSSRAGPSPTMAIAEHCGLPKSSAYSLLNAMERQRFVQHYAEDHAWGLGAAAFDIGSGKLRARSLSWLARSRLHDLAEGCGAVGHLGVLDGRDTLIAAKEVPEHIVDRVGSRVGSRLPAHLTAVGRSILMSLEAQHRQVLFPVREGLAKRTARGPDLIAELERELAEDRLRGYAIDLEMTSRGVVCVGAPVWSHEGIVVAAVSVSFTDAPSNLDDVGRVVQQTAADVSSSLGHPVDSPTTVGASEQLRRAS